MNRQAPRVEIFPTEGLAFLFSGRLEEEEN